MRAAYSGPSEHTAVAYVSDTDVPQAQPREPFHSRTHLPVLDGIRGAAISLVIVYHVVLFVHIRTVVIVDRIAFRLAETGWAGVDLFFVLSGFLITGILYDAKGGDGYFQNFYARRILRIFPLYYGFLGFLLFIVPRLPSFGQFSSLRGDQIWYWTYLMNVEVALRGWHRLSAVSHFWSLAVEEQFYLVWPWIVFVLNRRTLMRVCLGMVIASLCVRVALHAMHLPMAAFVLTPARMDALALGALVALIAREPGGLGRLKNWAPATVASSAVPLAIVFLWGPGFEPFDPVVATIGYTLLAILFAGILAVAVTAPPGSIPGRLFAHRFLRFLGRYSYALYIFHLPVILWTSRLIQPARIPSLAGSNLPALLLFVTVTASISLTAAVLSWHLFEAQLLKLKSLFPYESPARR